MKLSELEIGETYYINGNAPTDHQTIDPLRERYRQLIGMIDENLVDSHLPRLQATVRQVMGVREEWPTATVKLIGVPYKKGCHGVLMQYEDIEFTVHHTVIRSDADMVDLYDNHRAQLERWAAKYPDSLLVRRLVERGGF